MFEPVLVKILKFLKSEPRKQSPAFIADSIREELRYVNTALKELVTRGVVVEEEGLFYYKSTPRNEELSRKMFVLYDKLLKRPLLIRGILSFTPVRESSFFSILEDEGLGREQTEAFLKEEIRRGYVRKVRMMYVERHSLCTSLAPFFRLLQRKGYLDHEEYKQLKERCKELGIPFTEEEYLVGRYPPELSQPAQEYLRKDKERLIDLLRDEGLRLRSLGLGYY